MTGPRWEQPGRREEWLRWATQAGLTEWSRAQPQSQLRVSDAERDEAARLLGEHYAQGRLTAEEHGERSEQVWAARTYADLAPVFRDLPGGSPIRPVTGRAAPRPPAPARVVGGGAWWIAKLLLLGLVVVVVVTHVLPLLLVGIVAWWLLAITVGRWGQGRRRELRRQHYAACGAERRWL